MGIVVKNVTCDEYSALFEDKNLVLMIVKSTVFAFINVAVLFGNLLVILAVVKRHTTRSVTNKLILSLGVADFSLGVFVLPFSNANDVMGFWVFEVFWCQIWLVIDVWLCTASILNLCAISFDRYLAISQPMKYKTYFSTARRGWLLIASVWMLSFIISFPPLIGWKEDSNSVQTSISELTEEPLLDLNFTVCSLPICELNNDKGYVVYSALGSFFVPTAVMVGFYIKIYFIAKRVRDSIGRGRLRTGDGAMGIHQGGGSTKPTKQESNRLVASEVRNNSEKSTSNNKLVIDDKLNTVRRSIVSNRENYDSEPFHIKAVNDNSISNSRPTVVPIIVKRESAASIVSPSILITPTKEKRQHNLRRTNSEYKKASSHESNMKAAKTLAIVVGAFICCWMPFFTIYFLGAFCDLSGGTASTFFVIFFWLGYCNSLLNPVIYALFSKDFRYAFKKLLKCGRKKKYDQRKRRGFRYHVYQSKVISHNSDSIES